MKINTLMAVDFESEECCNCGTVFFMTTSLVSNLRKTKNTFYCPNGHGQSYIESEADRLKKQLKDKQSQYDIAQERIRQLTEQNKPKRRAVRKVL